MAAFRYVCSIFISWKTNLLSSAFYWSLMAHRQSTAKYDELINFCQLRKIVYVKSIFAPLSYYLAAFGVKLYGALSHIISISQSDIIFW